MIDDDKWMAACRKADAGYLRRLERVIAMGARPVAPPPPPPPPPGPPCRHGDLARVDPVVTDLVHGDTFAGATVRIGLVCMAVFVPDLALPLAALTAFCFACGWVIDGGRRP